MGRGKKSNSYIELPTKGSPFAGIENRNDNLSGFWYTLARLHPVKVSACRAKNRERKVNARL